MNLLTLAKCDTCPLRYGSGTEPFTYVPPKIKQCKYLFVGEAPGMQESLEKENFISPSGKLLKQTITQLGVSLDECAFINTVCCRPAKNETPPTTALSCCSGIFDHALEECNPERIIALGTTAKYRLGIKEQPGYWDFSSGTPSIHIEHPAFVLRQPQRAITFFRLLQKALHGLFTWNPPKGYTLSESPEQTTEVLTKYSHLSFDIECSNGLDVYGNLILCAGCYNDQMEKPFIVPLEHFFDPSVGRALETTKTKLVGNNITNYDAKVLFHTYKITLNDIEDTLHTDYVLNEAETGEGGVVYRGLGFLSSVLINAPDYKTAMKPYMKNLKEAPKDMLYKYNALDAICSWEVWKAEKAQFDDRCHRLYENTIKPFSLRLRQMSNLGVLVDRKYLEELGKEWQEVLEDKARHFPCNPRSPKQLSALLYDDLKIPRVNKNSTDEKTIQQLLVTVQDAPTLGLLNALLDYRGFEKLRATYCEGLVKLLTKDDYLHTDFLIGGANTGRISSKNPNLQNIPSRGEEGKRIKQAFIVPEGYEGFFVIDYAQLEARLAAIYSNDELMIRMINEGMDIHRYAAALWDGVPESEVTKERRGQIKNWVFAVLYGVTERGADYQFKLKKGEGAKFVRMLKNDIFSGLGSFIDKQHEFALEHNYVPYLDSDRIRRFPLITEQTIDDVLKHSVNSPIQGKGSDLGLEAACKCPGDLIRFPVHDSLCGYYRKQSEVEEIAEAMRVRKYPVLLDVEVSTGSNWGNCK